MYLNKQNAQNELSLLLPDFEKKSYLLAVSGGADSMVLADLFFTLNLNFQIAHINYKLRGDESDLDKKVVEDFCKKNGSKFHLYQVSEIDKKPENSIQLWARNVRYHFFEKIKKEENIDFIVTAHHLNDDLESFIINLSRASGLKGLSGIPKNENEILRPFLKFSKDEIYRFAKDNNIEFREDKSNEKNDYLRNFIRNEIAPQLLKTNEHFLENFSKTLTFLNDAKTFIHAEIEEKRKNLTEGTNLKIIFNKEKLHKESDFVKFELLKNYGFSEPAEISKIFKAENGSKFFSKNYTLKVSSSELIISSFTETKDDFFPILIDKTSQIHISDHAVNYTEQNKIWEIDPEKINWPIIIRQPISTDVFTPTGMKGKKKVAKFIKELKLSELNFQPLVLADSSGNIVGIIPHRQNGDFIAKSSKILKIFL